MRVLEFVPPFGNKWPFPGSYYPAQMHVKIYKIEKFSLLIKINFKDIFSSNVFNSSLCPEVQAFPMLSLSLPREDCAFQRKAHFD